MPRAFKILAIVPLLFAGAAAAQTTGEPRPAAAVPSVSILPKGGLFGMFGGETRSKATAQPEVSGTPASNTSYWTDAQGGGLFGFTGVASAERCTTKACNLYYGDGPTEDGDQAAIAPQAIEPVVPLAPAEEVSLPRLPRAADLTRETSRTKCAANAQDPWRCYR